MYRRDKVPLSNFGAHRLLEIFVVVFSLAVVMSLLFCVKTVAVKITNDPQKSLTAVLTVQCQWVSVL